MASSTCERRIKGMKISRADSNARSGATRTVRPKSLSTTLALESLALHSRQADEARRGYEAALALRDHLIRDAQVGGVATGKLMRVTGLSRAQLARISISRSAVDAEKKQDS